MQLKKKLSAVQHELEKTQVQLREEREAFAGGRCGASMCHCMSLYGFMQFGALC